MRGRCWVGGSGLGLLSGSDSRPDVFLGLGAKGSLGKIL